MNVKVASDDKFMYILYIMYCTKSALAAATSQFTLAWYRHQIMLACIPGG